MYLLRFKTVTKKLELVTKTSKYRIPCSSKLNKHLLALVSIGMSAPHKSTHAITQTKATEREQQVVQRRTDICNITKGR